jgi:flavin reductase (DIM6/NTAB) family NADH-FMN oxidoreductase RutF/rubredoxin
MFDVSVTPASEIVAGAFKWSHLVLASTTYNAGIFVTMEALISDLAAHNIQNRTAAIIENGSWAPASGGLMRQILEKCTDIHILDTCISIRSSLRASQLAEIEAMAGAIAATLPDVPRVAAKGTDIPAIPADRLALPADRLIPPHTVDKQTLFKLSYGLFVLTAQDGEKDNGCIINTVSQVTDVPARISITVNKANFTHEMIAQTGEFNISILSESVPFGIIRQYGFTSGKDADKFGTSPVARTANGIRYITEHTNGVISARVTDRLDCGTHTLFMADVAQAFSLSDEKSVTYQYYLDAIKPKPPAAEEAKKGWVCKICGYVYEGDDLPADFICPLCKHGAEDFARLC